MTPTPRRNGTATRRAGGRMASKHGAGYLRPKCAERNAQGEPCGMYALKGRTTCFAHDPERAADRARARRKGGKSKAYGPIGDGSPVSLGTTERLQTELETLYGQVQAQVVSPERARVLNALLGRGLELLGVGAFEERLAALEAATQQNLRRVA
jgi:hypothetical protein